MIKVKDGYAKLIGTTYLGSADRVLLSNGGDIEKAVASTANTLVLRNSSGLIESTLATGTAPFKITSTTLVNNLNANYLEGLKRRYRIQLDNVTATGPYCKLMTIKTNGAYIDLPITFKYSLRTSGSGSTHEGYVTIKILGKPVSISVTGDSYHNNMFYLYTISEEVITGNTTTYIGTHELYFKGDSWTSGDFWDIHWGSETNSIVCHENQKTGLQEPTNYIRVLQSTTGRIGGSVRKVIVTLNNKENAYYPLIWASPENETTSDSELFKSYNHLTYNPSAHKITTGCFVANNSSGPHFIAKSTAGNWAYIRLSNSTCYWDIATNNSSSYGTGGLWLSRYNGGDHGIFVSTTANVGISTANPSYKLDVNGHTRISGNLLIGANTTRNYIAFRGTTGDGDGAFNHTYIGENIYYGTESSELVLFKGNDLAANAANPNGTGPDRIRHIAAGHLFQIYKSALNGTFETICTSTVPVNMLAIHLNSIQTYAPLVIVGSQYNDNYGINMQNSDIVGINALYTADSAENGSEGLQFSRGNGYYDSVWASGGVLYFSPNGNLNRAGSYSNNYTVLHTGNFAYTWTAITTKSAWSRIMNMSSDSNVILTIEFSQSSQASSHTYFVNTNYGTARIAQIMYGGYLYNSNPQVRVTKSSETSFHVEVYNTYGYNGATTISFGCKAILAYGSMSTISTYTAGSGTVCSSLTSSNATASNFNSDMLDGYHESKFPLLNGVKSRTWNWNDVLRAGYYKILAGTITNHPSGIYQYGMAAVLTTENHADGENRELLLYYPHRQTDNIAIWGRMHNSGTQGNGWGSWWGIPNTEGVKKIINTYYWANVPISATSSTTTTPTFGSVFINTGDPTLKIYSGRVTDAKSDGNICLQTCIDGLDGQTHSYAPNFPARENLVLLPRGGQVYIGTNPDGGNTSYKLWVNGNTYASGSLYAAHFYENSDAKLKENIQAILNSDKMPIIKEFDWKEDNSHSYGLIAQELEEQGYSELVSVKDDGYKTVNYSAALSLIVGKLQVKIKELEKEIENLKNKN